MEQLSIGSNEMCFPRFCSETLTSYPCCAFFSCQLPRRNLCSSSSPTYGLGTTPTGWPTTPPWCRDPVSRRSRPSCRQSKSWSSTASSIKWPCEKNPGLLDAEEIFVPITLLFANMYLRFYYCSIIITILLFSYLCSYPVFFKLLAGACRSNLSFVDYFRCLGRV